MVRIPEKSKAAVLVDFGKPLEIKDLPIPEVEPRGILVKVEMAGICGTDIHQWKGDLGRRAPLPLVPGHETVGKILKLGQGRTHDCAGAPLTEGDRIMWAHVDCGECYFCKVLKQPALCVNRFGYGYNYSLTGSFAEYEYVVPKADVVKIPDGLTNEEVVGVCCAFRTAVAAFERLSGLGMQSTVVVQGVGPVGLYSIILAKIGGAGKIIAVGAPQVRLDLAKKWGVDEGINIEEYPDAAKRNEKIMALTDGRGADIVVEASGVPVAFGEGLDMIRRGGRYLVIGQTSPQGIIKMSPAAIVWKNMEIIGQCSADISHYYKALQIIKNNRQRFNFGAIITHKYSLEEINTAFASMVAGTDIKPALVP
jgi:D-arabinose 1-dehydrogenase-like Zn-dependent alcohol dehydrogenase